MNAIFEDENKLRKWMDVEIALAKAHAKMGAVPKDAVKKIGEGAEKSGWNGCLRSKRRSTMTLWQW